MTACHHCGGDIIFRHVDGALTPIHLDGRGCLGATAASARRFYREFRESCCHMTACPECGEEVYFIRYNGGCVWVNPPLGPPWPKHRCFDRPRPGRAAPAVSLISTSADYRIENTNKVVIGVVQAAETTFFGKGTVLATEYNNALHRRLYVSGSVTHLAGKLVIINQSRRVISARGMPEFEYGLIASLPAASMSDAPARLCRECDVAIRPSELAHHLATQHGITLAKG